MFIRNKQLKIRQQYTRFDVMTDKKNTKKRAGRLDIVENSKINALSLFLVG